MSIVIPTYGRLDLITSLLNSIREDAKHVDFEVEILLVDDSEEPAAAAIRAVAISLGATVVDAPSHSVGGNRNHGALLARYDLILFLDSDVKLRPGTLKAHFDSLGRAPESVAGCLGKVVFTGRETYAWRVVQAMQLTLPFSYPDFLDNVPWGPTANISMRRGPFFSVGGFDTTLPKYGGEDVDLGLRLARNGFRIMTSRNAVAEHAIETWSTWRQNIPRLWSYGLADFNLLMRHPDRSFVDFPTGPMLWTGQLLLLACLFAAGLITLQSAGAALGASVVSYPVVYAWFKRKDGRGFLVHLLGPIVFWTMDAAKAWESLWRCRPSLIFRRLRFLDDLISQDWIEIAASAWALSASAILFLGTLMLMEILK
jgi:GT2 family glycosyltransferase